ncbi:hypothetical protein [Moorena sp. SIO3B2]|uniref:hypothetical protein n=1 Tax=Moorena sp. SIO3B2 TaxID=2607827 RepID=UPI0013C5D812|nr:hypothetical protein [Moorena sp. SIO3B2]NEP31731.1 hypothetical protein [Moorena sp. SIO3B2]NEP31756.1 hypothetical protein [Moorena sp. SIO3B2]NES80759.1 hypothetical protein [Moorena sp. SIO2B7]
MKKDLIFWSNCMSGSVLVMMMFFWPAKWMENSAKKQQAIARQEQFDRRQEQKDYLLQDQQEDLRRQRELADTKAKHQIVDGGKVVVLSDYIFSPSHNNPPHHSMESLQRHADNAPGGLALLTDDNTPRFCVGAAVITLKRPALKSSNIKNEVDLANFYCKKHQKLMEKV